MEKLKSKTKQSESIACKYTDINTDRDAVSVFASLICP